MLFIEADAAALFGDADDISSDEERGKDKNDRDDDDVPRGTDNEEEDGRRSRSLEPENEQETAIQEVCILMILLNLLIFLHLK